MAVETIVVSSETMNTDSAVATSRSVSLKALGYSIGAASMMLFSPEFVSESERCRSDARAIFPSSVDNCGSAGTNIEDALEDMMIAATSSSGISSDENCWVEVF
jgi:hypothetical protein